MSERKIILFLCNWGPHVAYQTLQDAAAAIPGEIRMVRIPCTGRISKALLFKPFETGADGVALVGCKPGTCRYGPGTETAEQNVEDTRRILDLLGLGARRLVHGTFLPEEAGELLAFLQGFCSEVQSLPPTPALPSPRNEVGNLTWDSVGPLLETHDIYACQDCGKCSSACPLTQVGKVFSPRALAGDVIGRNLGSSRVSGDLWACLTCGLCRDRCPSAVDFPEFVRDLRSVFPGPAAKEHEAHGGFFQTLMRTMTSEGLKTRRWEALPGDIRWDPKGKVLFFGGCAPYFDVFFGRHLKVETGKILLDSLRLLNFFDIHPTLLREERCCGHDLLWTGDRENFLKLARLNREAILALGVEEILTVCPECHTTLKRDYPAFGVDLGIPVTHLYEKLEAEVDKGAIKFKTWDRALTFQDPCRLSRREDLSALPRRLLTKALPGGWTEMRDSGRNALCCGNAAWSGCDASSKALQVKRLRQARETGAELLVTACPKCQIHLRCAMEDPFLGQELEMEIVDLTHILADTLEWR